MNGSGSRGNVRPARSMKSATTKNDLKKSRNSLAVRPDVTPGVSQTSTRKKNTKSTGPSSVSTVSSAPRKRTRPSTAAVNSRTGSSFNLQNDTTEKLEKTDPTTRYKKVSGDTKSSIKLVEPLRSKSNGVLVPQQGLRSGKLLSGQSPKPPQKPWDTTTKPTSSSSRGDQFARSATRPTASKLLVEPDASMSIVANSTHRVVPSESFASDISNVNTGEQTNQYQHPYFSLPEAVRVKILKYLTPTERLLAQFVCRRFRNDIRLRVGIRTKVTEATTNGLTFLRDVLVTSLFVGKYDRPLTPPSKMIYTPENIFELIFSESICAQHIDAFLNRLRKLKWLVVKCQVTDSPIYSGTFKNPYFSFEWRTLEAINKFPIPQPQLAEVIMNIPGSYCLRTVNRVLSLVNAPSLRKFSLVVSQSITYDECTAVHFAAINFLRNNLGVTHILISTRPKPNQVRPPPRVNTLQYMEREINHSVDELHLRQLSLTEPTVSFDIWNSSISTQTSLEVFQVLHMTIWPVLRDVVLQNSKTLVTVALHAILMEKLNKFVPIDLTVFSKCGSLKELYICIASSAVGDTGLKEAGRVSLINFHKLPTRIEVLGLKHCHVSVKDMLSVRNLPRLKSFGLVHYGTYMDGNYIGTAVVRKLLHIRPLDELFVSGISGDNKETETMKTFVKRLKIRVATNKKKQLTHLHLHSGDRAPRWTVQKNGSIVFTLLSTWGLANL